MSSKTRRSTPGFRVEEAGMDFVFKMMGFVFKMMNFALQMVNFVSGLAPVGAVGTSFRTSRQTVRRI